MEYVKFSSAIEIASYDSAGTVPTVAETDAMVILESDVLATSVISAPANTQATLMVDFTVGSLTNVLIKFYGSYLQRPGSGDWFSETIETNSSGVLTITPINITMTGTTKAMWHFPIGACKAYKITVQGTGTATGSSIKLYLGMRNN
jgi:hypothetical protein